MSPIMLASDQASALSDNPSPPQEWDTGQRMTNKLILSKPRQDIGQLYTNRFYSWPQSFKSL